MKRFLDLIVSLAAIIWILAFFVAGPEVFIVTCIVAFAVVLVRMGGEAVWRFLKGCVTREDSDA